jgi:hypothetical protein
MLRFFHIPKTAGMSICKAMDVPAGHAPIINPKLNDFIFSCVRNPYDRATSLFYYLTDKCPPYTKQFMADGETVNSFWTGKASHIRPITFTQPQKAWLEDIERIDKLIRFETLAEDWAEMQQAFDLPELEHRNASTSRPATPWQDELTQESIAIIGELYADDFEHLGYERIS